MNTKLIATAALASLAVFSAHAFQGEESPLPPQPFHSTLSRAEVQAQALRPLKISNGGSGVLAPAGMANRAAVREGAKAIAANGAATYGDFSN
jgi:hypothetical protein